MNFTHSQYDLCCHPHAICPPARWVVRTQSSTDSRPYTAHSPGCSAHVPRVVAVCSRGRPALQGPCSGLRASRRHPATNASPSQLQDRGLLRPLLRPAGNCSISTARPRTWREARSSDLELGGCAQDSGHSRGQRGLHGCHKLCGYPVDGRLGPHARRPPRRRQNWTPPVVAEQRQVLGWEVSHRAHKGRRLRPIPVHDTKQWLVILHPLSAQADCAQCRYFQHLQLVACTGMLKLKSNHGMYSATLRCMWQSGNIASCSVVLIHDNILTSCQSTVCMLAVQSRSPWTTWQSRGQPHKSHCRP